MAPADSASGEQIWLWLSGDTWLSRFCNLSSLGNSKKIVDFHFIRFLLAVRMGVKLPGSLWVRAETTSSFTRVLHNFLSLLRVLSPGRLLCCHLHPSWPSLQTPVAASVPASCPAQLQVFYKHGALGCSCARPVLPKIVLCIPGGLDGRQPPRRQTMKAGDLLL